MTCIVGITDGTNCTIGGDSAGVGGYRITTRSDAKVWSATSGRGRYVFGFTTSFRMGQLLRYSLSLPEPPESDLERFMCTTFIDRVRRAFTDGGWIERDSNREHGGTFLVGLNGRLFAVQGDFQVAESADGYMAIGCGDELALGSLHTSTGTAHKRIESALSAAAYHSAGVCAPFVIETNKGDK